MSSYQEKIHRIIGNTITATVPLALWTGLRDSVQWAYAEAYDSTKHDTRIVESQRRFKAASDRHFLTEFAMSRVAKEVGATFTPGLVQENGWRFGLLSAGKIAFTQKCITHYGEMPPAGKFRETLAVSSEFIRQGKLAFMQDAAKVSDADINGILVHCPETRNFENAAFKNPSFICLAVPLADYSDWAARFELSELIASYDVIKAPRKDLAPKWKKTRRGETGDDA